MLENILITICAREGSVGVPDKNIKRIAGVPLIGYAIRLAEIIRELYNADVAISTDSMRYLDIAREYGIDTEYVRPKYLANSDAGKVDVFRDVLAYYEKINKKRYDYLLDLEVTSPLRNIEDINSAFNLIKKDKKALVVYGASLSAKNPYYNLVEKQKDGYYKLCIQGGGACLARQRAPKVYESNGMLYLFKRAYFDGDWATIFTDRTLIYDAPHICFDIDEQIDFDIMEYMIVNNKLDFELFK